MATYLGLEGLNNKNLFLSGLEAGSLRSRCHRVGSEASLLGLPMAAFLPHPHLAFSLCTSLCLSSYKDTSLMGLGPLPFELL